MPFTTSVRTGVQGTTAQFGFWLTFPSAAAARTILRAAAASPGGGFSWVVIDAEHGLINDQHYYELTNAIAAEGASPLIRVPWAEEYMIKRALDSGAHGVLTPLCHTAADARRIVAYSKYPPTGTRGYGPMYAGHAFRGLEAPGEYDAGADGGLVVAVQIESRAGVENVEEIAGVEGLDVLLIGPNDLALSLGVEKGSKEHEDAILKILNATKKANKKAAIFCSGGEQAKQRIDQGFDMVSVIMDIGVLETGFQRELGIARGQEYEAKDKKGGY